MGETGKPKVEVYQGVLCGSVGTAYNGETFFRFQGIPFAQPPLGNLRFKAPVPPGKWSGVLDATKEGSPSYGRHMFDKNRVEGNEDCLFLNVYTKNLGAKILNPVMFYLHPGGFVYGSGGTEFHGPEFLLVEDVVVVTVNHRLGILGFLSLEDPALEVPGNAAFKDIVMALKWVHNNIDKFGGDPNNVTIFGNSAGGVAVHLLMLSKMSRGLFHKAALQSASALMTFGQGRRGVEAISRVLKVEGERNVYKKLAEMSVEEIYQVQIQIDNIFTHVACEQRNIGYVVEKESHLEPFLVEDPLTLLQRGDFCQIPLLIGYAKAEFLAFRDYYGSGPGSDTCEYLIPFFLGHQIGSRESLTIAKKMRLFYFGNDSTTKYNSAKKNFINVDMCILYGLFLALWYHRRWSKVPMYLFRLSLDTKLNFIKKYYKIRMSGATHCDDIGYLFKNLLTPDIEPGSVEDLSVRRFVKMWTNFAKCGNPIPRYDSLLGVVWKPVSKTALDFLDIGEELVASANPEEFRRMKYLKKIFEESATAKKLKMHL